MDLTPTRRNAGLTAGAALLAMAVVAGVANAAVVAPLADLPAADLADRLAGSAAAFRWAVLAFFVVAALDVAVAWSLRTFFAPSGPTLADVQAGLRTAAAAVLTVAVGHLVAADRLVSAGAPADQVRSEVDAFFETWSLSLGLFALHLIVVAVLALRTPGMPRVLAPLLAVSGAGYLADTMTAVLLPGRGTSLAAVTFVGEVALLGWLLWVARPQHAPAAPEPVAAP
ncbi:DUF4386 domain-containing protein [Kineosporia sp. R_H_3]|uniref:DUF4386 domain-containing protein n=1 Tax=Kineosporia sp. R_H_3 TaxID=1961848 RepID=UPI000B4B2B81|nr:DUF4386 domain-containing protein [Kineosporia sp. R_H_3]